MCYTAGLGCVGGGCDEAYGRYKCICVCVENANEGQIRIYEVITVGVDAREEKRERAGYI